MPLPKGQTLKDRILDWVKKQKREVTTTEVCKALISDFSIGCIKKALPELVIEGKIKVRRTTTHNYYRVEE